MDQAQITKWTRRGIREFKPDRVSDAEITLMTLEGVTYLGLILKSLDSSLFRVEKVLQDSAGGYIFDKPSDAMTIERLWDLQTTATTITGAADNGSGLIRITTSAAHGFADAAVMTAQDVGGCTEANGIFTIDYDTTLHTTSQFDLVGSAFVHAYTSGGICYVRPSSPSEIRRINLEESSGAGSGLWYPRGTKIVLDNMAFTNDIILSYIKHPSAITDIPDEFHLGLVAFNVVHLMSIPPRLVTPTENNVQEVQDKMESLNRHKGILALMEDRITGSHQTSLEPIHIPEEFSLDNEVES